MLELKYSLHDLLFQSQEYNVGSVNMLSWLEMMSWVSVYFGIFFPSLRVMHCKFTVIRGMQICFWELQCIHAASKHRAVFNVCSICSQGLEEQKNFWNIRKLPVEKCQKRTSPSHLGFVSFIRWMWFHRAQRKWHDLSTWINTDSCSPIGGICDPPANVAFGQTPFGRMLTPWGLGNIDHVIIRKVSAYMLTACSAEWHRPRDCMRFGCCTAIR